jgi:hypothetical protein
MARMKTVTLYHHLGFSNNSTIDLLCFDRIVRKEQNNDTYGSLAAKVAKEDGASESYVKRNAVEPVEKKGAVLEVRDGGWIIV